MKTRTITLLSIAAMIFAFQSCSLPKKQAESKNITHITSLKEFEKQVLNSNKPVIVKFHAPWCSACTTMKPVFSELADKRHTDYNFVSINVDKAKPISKKYEIKGIPTFLLFNDGEEVNPKKRIVGVVMPKQFERRIEKTFTK